MEYNKRLGAILSLKNKNAAEYNKRMDAIVSIVPYGSAIDNLFNVKEDLKFKRFDNEKMDQKTYELDYDAIKFIDIAIGQIYTCIVSALNKSFGANWWVDLVPHSGGGYTIYLVSNDWIEYRNVGTTLDVYNEVIAKILDIVDPEEEMSDIND